MTKRKPTIYVEYEIIDYFNGFVVDLIYSGSRGIRLLKIREIVDTIFDFSKGYPLTDLEEWYEWLVIGCGISKRTAKEYMVDAEIHTLELIEEIAQKA